MTGPRGERAAGGRTVVYTDGACLGNPGPGGWAAVLVGPDGKRVLSGGEARTTNNRMEMTAAIKALEALPPGAPVTIHSDSEYLVNTMTRGWKRRANLDLWERLDRLVAQRPVSWRWVRGHAGDPLNEEANARAQQEAQKAAGKGREGALTHVDPEGKASMVDVGHKPETQRVAVARASVTMRPETLALIRDNRLKKGDVLAVARVAGIMAAKRTWELIPLCHPLPLDQVSVEFRLDAEASAVHLEATARTTARTGVEMEALTAAAVAALTIYDMCKAVDRAIRVEALRLVRKTGGQSGDVLLEE